MSALADIMSSLTCIVVMVLVLKFWKPNDPPRGRQAGVLVLTRIRRGLIMARCPTLSRRVRAAAGGDADIKLKLNQWTPACCRHGSTVPNLNRLAVPDLHNVITQMPP